MTHPPFKEYLFQRFVKWEQEQPNKRSSFSAFARWLSENSLNVEIKQQLISYWLKGKYEPSEDKYILALAEKLGLEIYDILDAPRPDPFITYVAGKADRLKDEQKKKIEEQIAKYLTANEKESSTR